MTPRPNAIAGDLADTVVLVSGASRGIGRDIARTLARAGANVAGLARSEDELATLRSEIEAAGRRFLPVVADVTEVEAHADIIAKVCTWADRPLDGLVNAAGTIVRGEPLSIAPADWDLVMDVNARAAFFLCQAAGKSMLEGRGGAIVNVASLAGQYATGASVTYSASKAALAQLSRVLAVRWAPTVRVNAVGPGYVRTDLNSSWLDDAENLRYVLQRTPLARLGETSDVSELVAFLLSPRASYITGQHILLDGGWSAQ